MSRPTREDRIAALDAELPPAFQEFARWLTVDLFQELTGKVVALGLPPDLAQAVAGEAVKAIAGKVERAAELLAASMRATTARQKPS